MRARRQPALFFLGLTAPGLTLLGTQASFYAIADEAGITGYIRAFSTHHRPRLDASVWGFSIANRNLAPAEDDS